MDELNCVAPYLLFITRKYPPARGGMEEFSRCFYEAYPGPKRLVALRHRQGWLPLFVLRVVAEAVRERSRVEHVHLGDALLVPLAPLIGRLTGAPVTATVHGLDVTRSVPPYQWMISRAFRRLPAGIIAVSDFTRSRVMYLAGVPARVITNGVDLERFQKIQRSPDPVAARATLGLPEHGPLIVSVGRFVRRKGVAWFIESVLPLLPDNIVFVVAGDGPHRDAVRRAAAGDQRVVLLGEVESRTIDQIYACADLFIAPNIAVPGQPEGYGIAPAEAAAAGLPVLVSDLEGLQDMGKDTGVPLIPPGDSIAWAEAILRAVAEPSWARPTKPPRSWLQVAQDYVGVFVAIPRPLERRRHTVRTA